MVSTKSELSKDLVAHGLNYVAKFVDSGYISQDSQLFYKRIIPTVDDKGNSVELTEYPLANAFEKHLNYRIHIARNYGDNNEIDRQSILSHAEDLCNLFESTYNIPVKSCLRFKSPKSIAGKLMTLEIERISKLIALKASAPDKVKEEQQKYIERINNDSNLSDDEKTIRNYVQNNEHKFNTDILIHLLKSRVDERYYGDDAKEYYRYIESLLDPKVPLDYDLITSKFFGNDNFSDDTQSALARIFFYRVTYDKERIVSDGENQKIVPCTEEFRSEFLHENFTLLNDSDSLESNPLKKAFKYASIQRIETDCPEWNEDCYVHRYSSRLERLVDENEFLRVKDLVGMNIIVPEKVPNSYHLDETTSNPEINKLNKSLNERLDNILSEGDYSSVSQRKLYTILDDFISRIKTNSFNENEKLDCKILPDSLKQWRKWGKFYLADHIKLELMNNPMAVLELHLESDEIYKHEDLSHVQRKGKQRIFPDLICSLPYDMGSLPRDKQDEILSKYDLSKYTLFLDNLYYYLPFYNTRVKDEETGKYYFKDLSLEKNCSKYYGIYDSAFSQDEEASIRYKNLHWMLGRVKEIFYHTHQPISTNKQTQLGTYGTSQDDADDIER